MPRAGFGVLRFFARRVIVRFPPESQQHAAIA
jgi:hypothetical protein